MVPLCIGSTEVRERVTRGIHKMSCRKISVRRGRRLDAPCTDLFHPSRPPSWSPEGAHLVDFQCLYCGSVSFALANLGWRQQFLEISVLIHNFGGCVRVVGIVCFEHVKWWQLARYRSPIACSLVISSCSGFVLPHNLANVRRGKQLRVETMADEWDGLCINAARWCKQAKMLEWQESRTEMHWII